MSQLSPRIKITKVQDHTVAGTSAVNSDAVDMAGFEGVLFVTSFGTAAANNLVNAAQETTSNGTFADLLGTSVTSGTSDEDVWLDIYMPQERYVRLEVARGTSSTLESIWAIQYGAKKQPVTNSTSGTIIGEAHVSEIEGTA
jgi:hypothetical protein